MVAAKPVAIIAEIVEPTTMPIVIPRGTSNITKNYFDFYAFQNLK